VVQAGLSLEAQERPQLPPAVLQGLKARRAPARRALARREKALAEKARQAVKALAEKARQAVKEPAARRARSAWGAARCRFRSDSITPA
jgi:hypothetical protein